MKTLTLSQRTFVSRRSRRSKSQSVDAAAWIVAALLILIALSLCASLHAQAPAAPKSAKKAYFFDPAILSLAFIVPAPPQPDSATTRSELAEVHAIEKGRTAAEVEAAKADDADETIFAFRTVLGPAFTAESFPLTAALSEHVHGEEAAAGLALKTLFSRPRPYQADKTLHPVCKLTEAPNSYPSGHTLSGYLLGFTLAELLPERAPQILARADNYAHNRLVCGVHYPSDLEASHRIAYAVFGALMTDSKFQADLAAAREELRKQYPVNASTVH